MRYPIFILSLLAGVVIYMPAVPAASPDWSAYDRILDHYLADSAYGDIRFRAVNYRALRTNRDFSEIVQALESYPLSQLETPEEYLSFYINAYNILAIKIVLDQWPLQSIKDAGSWLNPVWDKTAGRIGGHNVSLDEIEHRILRPMGEPRIHFAIVCASISCPDLRRKAYHADKLDQQLDDQAREFLSNPGKGLRIENGTVRISRIFDWFEDDFAKTRGVAAFLERYADIPPKHRITADLPYNWKLNSQSDPQNP